MERKEEQKEPAAVPASIRLDAAKSEITAQAYAVFQKHGIQPDLAYQIMENVSLEFSKLKSEYLSTEFRKYIMSSSRKEGGN